MFTVEFYDSENRLVHNATVKTLEELGELASDGKVSIKITGTGTIGHEEAMAVVEAYGEAIESDGLLETLKAMKSVDYSDALSPRQKHAFDFIFGGMQRLFHGDEA